MNILLVGPSGVGKTKAGEQLRDKFGVHFHHLDGLATSWALKYGWIDRESVSVLRRFCNPHDDLFLAVGLQAIADNAARDGSDLTVIDVGAGFQEATYAYRLPSLYPTIAVVADLATAYQRWRTREDNENATLAEYERSEFSAKRRHLYEACHATIDSTTLSLIAVADRLWDMVRKLAGDSRREA